MALEPTQSPKTSVYATAAFIACFGFIFPLLFFALPFILAIMALSEIRKSNGAIKGKGLAMSAMLIPVVVVILTVAIMAASLCSGHHPHDWTGSIECRQNLRMIALSMLMYSEDYKGFFPDSLDNSYIRESVGSDKIFVCPYCQKTGEKYVLLPDVGGKKLKDFDNPKETPVIICRHHRKQDNVLYADGHVSQVHKDEKTSR